MKKNKSSDLNNKYFWPEHAIVFLLVFFIPTQLAYHVWPEWSFLYGIRIDYLSIKIYLTDLLIYSLFILYFLRTVINRKKCSIKNVNPYKILWFFIAVLFIFVNISLSINWQNTFFKWIRIFQLIFVFLYLKNEKYMDVKKYIYLPLTYSAIFFVAIGLAQFVRQSTVGGVFYYLGERTFNSQTPGIALVSFMGNMKMRAYSTFPHPNVFAGYLVAVFFLVKWYLENTKVIGVIRNTILATIVLGVFITFSKSAVFALIVVYIINKININTDNLRKWGMGLLASSLIFTGLFTIFGSKFIYVGTYENVYLRLLHTKVLNESSYNNIVQGVGLNNFVYLGTDLLLKEGVWWPQPIHNIYLLIFLELGVVGLLAFIFLMYKCIENKRKHTIMAILVVVLTGVLDHYWLTLWQTMLMLTFVISLSLRNEKY